MDPYFEFEVDLIMPLILESYGVLYLILIPMIKPFNMSFPKPVYILFLIAVLHVGSSFYLLVISALLSAVQRHALGCPSHASSLYPSILNVILWFRCMGI